MTRYRPRHGRRRRPASRFVALLAAAALVGATVAAIHEAPSVRPGKVNLSLVDDSSSTTTTTTTTTTTDPTGDDPTVTVPTDYTDQLDSYYNALFDVVSSVPGATTGATSITDPADFATQVAGLTPDELADLYQASAQFEDYASQTPALDQIATSTSETTEAMGVHVTAASTRRATLSAHASRAVITHDATGAVVTQDLTVIPDQEPTAGSWAGDVSGLSLSYVANCPNGAPTNNDPYGEYDIFAIDEGLDAAYAVYNLLSAGMPEYDFPIVGPISHTAFAVAAAIAAAIALALQIAYDTLNWENAVAGDCQSSQIQQMTLDEDNNAYQTYQLLTQAAATENEIDSNVANLTNQEAAELAKLTTLAIEQALAAPTTQAPEARMELPGPTGLLDTTPGVQEVVVNEITQMQSAGQLGSPTATRDLGLAEQAQSDGQDKLAFSYYQLAYQAASS